jgi:hypothetical protein
MVPELVDLDLPDETRANCASCHMVPSAGGCSTSPWQFHEDVRCCTFHPILANYFVGRALSRENAGSERIRLRIAEGTGVVPMGVTPSNERHERQLKLDEGEFGRNPALLCPYYVGGTHTCGIWQDRNAVCRTWHCRHLDGPRGRNLWAEMQNLLEHMETRLSRWCADQAESPSPGDPVEAWEAWYRACADRVDTVPDDALADMRDSTIERALRQVLEAAEARSQPMPDVLVPHVAQVIDEDDGVRLGGYWPYDSRHLPRTIFLLLAALDGERTWRQAIAQVEAETGLRIAEEEVEDLYSAGLLDLDGEAVERGTWHMTVRVNGDAYTAGGAGPQPITLVVEETAMPDPESGVKVFGVK